MARATNTHSPIDEIIFSYSQDVLMSVGIVDGELNVDEMRKRYEELIKDKEMIRENFTKVAKEIKKSIEKDTRDEIGVIKLRMVVDDETEYFIDQEVIFGGRFEECDIRFEANDLYVSRIHFVIFPTTNGIIIVDPGSLNGIVGYVDGTDTKKQVFFCEPDRKMIFRIDRHCIEMMSNEKYLEFKKEKMEDCFKYGYRELEARYGSNFMDSPCMKKVFIPPLDKSAVESPSASSDVSDENPAKRMKQTYD